MAGLMEWFDGWKVDKKRTAMVNVGAAALSNG
jgi:hypothetical protein